MGVAVYLSYYKFPLPGIAALAVSILMGIVVFIVCSYLLKCEELLSLLDNSKFGKNKNMNGLKSESTLHIIYPF